MNARSEGPLGSEVFFTPDDRVAIVTGGGSGIGQAAARRLADLGIAVVVVGRRGEAVAQVARAITSSGGSALAVRADLGDPLTPADVVSGPSSGSGGSTLSLTTRPLSRPARLTRLPRS